ncbi:MAG: putative transporter permease protein [Ilumatobacteraceae bacterium]|nr:putative transporter permease protein [Ilumatobacteraceae bacterium]MCU1390394.1 putative transporter permease protein [Ilumatobacteraceae bacterium]
MNLQPPIRVVDVRVQSAPDPVDLDAKSRAAKLLRLAAPVIGLAVFFLVWQFGVAIFDIKKFLLPKPTDILSSINGARSFYLRMARSTVWESFLGGVIAFVLAMIGATLMAHSRFIERAVTPLALLVQVTPIVAYVPAIVAWQGFGLHSIVVVTSLVCFVPFLINGVSGFRSVDPSLVELARSVDASTREVFLRLRLPSALPNLFSAARIAVGLALIGAVLGEFYAGSTSGLGYAIKTAQNRSQLRSQLWGSIYVLGFIGATATLIVNSVERFALRWHSSQRT